MLKFWKHHVGLGIACYYIGRSKDAVFPNVGKLFINQLGKWYLIDVKVNLYIEDLKQITEFIEQLNNDSASNSTIIQDTTVSGKSSS